MIFKLKDRVGNHTMEDGTKLKAGEHVESDTDLVKRFRGKFERVRTKEDILELPSKSDLLKKNADSKSDEVDNPEDSTSSEESVDGDDNVDEIDDDEDDSTEDDTKDEELVPVKSAKALGKKVTSKFPVAGQLGVRVYETSKGWYVVYDPDEKVLLNPKGKKLRKKAIETLLDSYVDED